MSEYYNIGTLPILHSNAIVFELEKTDENEVFSIDNYTVKIDERTWNIAETDVVETIVEGKTTYLITWVYSETDFALPGDYYGCLNNTTNQTNKYLNLKFKITFESNC